MLGRAALLIVEGQIEALAAGLQKVSAGTLLDNPQSGNFALSSKKSRQDTSGFKPKSESNQ
jgi:hypothetical protein